MSDARTEALARFPYPVDVHTGEPVDDWGYEEYAREAFIAGAEWQAERIARTLSVEHAKAARNIKTRYGQGQIDAYAHAARIAREVGKQ